MGGIKMDQKITTAEFEEKVLKSEVAVLVDFYADWCGPCKMMSPIVERIAESYVGKLVVYKLNVDEEPEIAARYRVMSIPTMIVYKDGEAKLTSIGAMSQNDLEEKINSVI